MATLALGLVVVAAQAGAALGGLPLASPERRSTVSTATRAAGAPDATGAAGTSGTTGISVVVREGDSLWSIAARLAPADADLRGIVDELSDARDGAPLIPGETIRFSD